MRIATLELSMTVLTAPRATVLHVTTYFGLCTVDLPDSVCNNFHHLAEPRHPSLRNPETSRMKFAIAVSPIIHGPTSTDKL